MFNKIKFKGDIALSSGKKTEVFYDFHLWTPKEWEICSIQLAEKIRKELPEFYFIVSPATGGIIVGHEIAKYLNKPFYICEKNGEIKPSFFPKASYIIVDDVISSNNTVDKVQSYIDNGRNFVGSAAFVYRGKIELACDLCYLHRGEIEV